MMLNSPRSTGDGAPIEAFSLHGYNGVSLRTVNDQLGVSRATCFISGLARSQAVARRRRLGFPSPARTFGSRGRPIATRWCG